MWFALGFALACAMGAYFYGSWLVPGGVLCALIAALAFVLTRWNRKFRVLCAVLLGFAIGLSWFAAFDSWKQAPARKTDEQTLRLRISITDYSWDTDYGTAADGKIILGGQHYKARVYLSKNETLAPGDSVWGDFYIRFTGVGNTREPTYHHGEGIFILAYQDGFCISERFYEPKFENSVARWRQELLDTIDRSFPEDTQGFARALLFGDRTGIDYELSSNFEITGVSHIIAVSGMHVSIVFSLLYILAGKRRILTALLGLPAIILFAALAGFTPSITRACIMQCVMLLALCFNREYDQMTSLGTAALVMLLVNPMVITSVSFQLSAGCMAGIFLFTKPITRWLMDEKRLGRWNSKVVYGIVTSVAVTLGAMIFTTPLTAWHFGSVSLIGLLTNLLTLWLVTVIFYGILLVCLLGLFSGTLAGILACGFSWLIRLMFEIVDVLANVPLAAVYTQSAYIVIWLILIYVLFGVFLILRKRHVNLLVLGITAGLCIAVLCSWIEPMLYECSVTVLDVGQGQSVILQSNNRTFLVDCGGDYSEDAADIAAENLQAQGISRLDGLILTHYDADHAGGAEYLLSRVQVDALYLPYADDPEGVAQRLRERSKAQCITVVNDMILTAEGVTITIFAPISYNSGNESSLCVLFQTENCDILITGDRSEATERVLLEHYDLPKLEVLIAGHHGSKHSTSLALLEATVPEYVFISAGKDNRYGHPAQELLARLEEFDCKVFRTDIDGTIVLRR